MKKGDEVLVVPSGLAVTLEHFAREYHVVGSGVEDDPILLARAEERLRVIGMLERVHVQAGEMDGLPFRDGIFDVVIAELGLTSRVSAESAVAEMVRVAKPGASVVLVQAVWKAPVDPVRREILSQHLGCCPLMVVEWKRLLRDAGVEGLHTEDWSDEETAFRPQITKPFPDFSELFTFREKLGILHRARQRWGWVAVGTALARVREVHKLLTQERVLGLDLVMGLKRVETGVEGTPAQPSGDVEAPAEDARAEEGEQVSGLPLFGDGGEDPK
jgi:SAM-dependent methyltransferase